MCYNKACREKLSYRKRNNYLIAMECTTRKGLENLNYVKFYVMLDILLFIALILYFNNLIFYVKNT